MNALFNAQGLSNNIDNSHVLTGEIPPQHKEAIKQHALHIASLADDDDIANAREFNDEQCYAIVDYNNETIVIDYITYSFDLSVRYEFDIEEDGDGYHSPYYSHIRDIEVTDIEVDLIYDETNEINHEGFSFKS